MSKEVRQYVARKLQARYGIVLANKRAKPNPKSLNRNKFIKVMNLMEEIDERQNFLLDELGIDLLTYESKYFEVIELLFAMTFTHEQNELIANYFVLSKEDRKGLTIVLTTAKQGDKEVKFETANDLWNAIQMVK